MLVLDRFVGQSIMIGDEIVVTVLEVFIHPEKGIQLKLGFHAPPNISVHREEVYERILRSREDLTTR